MQDIISDLLLCNFRETSADITLQLLNSKQADALQIHFNDINYSKFPRIEGTSKKFKHPDAVGMYIKTHLNILYKVLELGNGKLSLCGDLIIGILSKGAVPFYNADLYFHCDTVEEADILLHKCIDIINKDGGVSRYFRYQEYILIGARYIYFRFICRVYKSKGQILSELPLLSLRYGYNLIDGFFTTICGAFAYAMNGFHIKMVSINLLSYRDDLIDSINRGFTILLSDSLIWRQFQDYEFTNIRNN